MKKDSDGQKHDDDSHKAGQNVHHILPNDTGRTIFVILLILTFATVIASRIDFGFFNFPIAMAIACIKAALVVLFFMGLKYDNNENRIIFMSSFVFFTLFILLTASDLFTRGNNKVVGNPLQATASGASKFKKPWIETAELKAHGKELFQQNCVLCHGAEGLGNGVAAAALNPKPRNFTQAEGWKNGRKPSQVFGTVSKGLNQMPSFSTLSTDDRWSVAHYVLSLGPKPDTDSPEDLKAIGIDPNKEQAAEVVQRKIPVDFAIERYLGNEQKL